MYASSSHVPAEVGLLCSVAVAALFKQFRYYTRLSVRSRNARTSAIISWLHLSLPVRLQANDLNSTAGVDLRMTFLPAKLKQAGYATAMIGKSHLGARSVAHLPINRGFDQHFGFLGGGEDHFTQVVKSSYAAAVIADALGQGRTGLGPGRLSSGVP